MEDDDERNSVYFYKNDWFYSMCLIFSYFVHKLNIEIYI